MNLIEDWKNNPESIKSKKLHQIISWAGNGKITNESTYTELREYFSHIPTELLSNYVNECLGVDKFPDSGFVLQDIINEVGQRLGYKVTHGLFKGKKGSVNSYV